MIKRLKEFVELLSENNIKELEEIGNEKPFINLFRHKNRSVYQYDGYDAFETHKDAFYWHNNYINQLIESNRELAIDESLEPVKIDEIIKLYRKIKCKKS
jgi:hypothetical protein